MLTNTRFGTCKKLHDFSHFTRRVFHELIGCFTHPWAKTLSLSPSMYVWIYTYENISLKTIYHIKYIINISIHIYVLVGEPNPLTTTSNKDIDVKQKKRKPHLSHWKLQRVFFRTETLRGWARSNDPNTPAYLGDGLSGWISVMDWGAVVSAHFTSNFLKIWYNYHLPQAAKVLFFRFF